MKTEQINDRYLGQDNDTDEIEITSLSGSYVHSADGKKYIDFLMGWCVGNFGWNNPNIKKRLTNFNGPHYVPPHYQYKPWVELASRLTRITPGNLQKCFRATGGSEAVEIAISAAMSFTERTKFISVKESYHGNTIAARSIGSPEFGKWYKNPLSAHRISEPFDAKSAQEIDQWLKKGDIAGLIMEPIIINRGVMIPTNEFMQIIQESCKKHGTLLIMDEVASGFGRTGKLFASEHYKLKPDIMCLAKSMSGGFAGIGATLMTEEVANSIEDHAPYSTYGWHPYSVEAALGVLDYLDENFTFLEVNIREMGHYIVDQLSLMEFEEEPIICQKGLALGVSFESEDYGERIVEKARQNGLLITTSDKGFSMFPALNISKPVIDEALDILINSI